MPSFLPSFFALFFALFVPSCYHICMFRMSIQMPSSCPHFAFLTFMQNEDMLRSFEMTCEICNYGNRWAQRGQKWGQTRNCKNDLFFLNEYWLLKKGLIFFKGIGYGSLETHAICLLPMLDSANLLWKLFCMEVLHCIDCRTFVLILTIEDEVSE